MSVPAGKESRGEGMADKAALRREIRRLLADAPPLPPNPSFHRLLLDSPLFQGCTALVGYLPIQAELPVLPLLEEALRQGKSLFLPRFQDGQYTLAQARDLDRDLVDGLYGIPEPAPACPEPNPLPENTLWLIPGLAFDRQGNRLGRGKGYYDRLRQRFPQGTTLGLCRECQLRKAPLPTAPWDRPVNAILTPTQWVLPHEQSPS